MDFYRHLLVIWSLPIALSVVNASENIALGKTTHHSSNYGNHDSSKAVDGCTNQTLNSNCCSHTDEGHTEAWWQVDLQTQSVIDSVTILYRNSYPHRQAGYEVYLSNTPDWTSGNRCHKDSTPNSASMLATQYITCPGVARYLTIYNDRREKTHSWYSDTAILELCEVQVYGCPYGKYGNGNCNRVCTNCLNNICDTTFGCYDCTSGYYKIGGECVQCPDNCVGNTCNSLSGACLDCNNGYYGPACTPCPDGCSTNTCNKTTGQCFVCDDGLFGSFCDQTCSSNCENNVCERVSGQCPDCNDGFHGPTCTPCPVGCSSTTCDKMSGRCFQCADGFFSSFCNQSCPLNCKSNVCSKDYGQCTECDDGYHGYFCNQPCPANCKHSVCKINNGICTECVAGYHGNQCEKNCPPNCNGGLCNQTNGLCIGCEAEFHGSNCSLSCPDNCKDLICNQDNGQCIACVSGFHGNKCLDRCGYCQDGRCDKDTGNCMTSCINGLTGDRCDVKVVVVNVPSEGEDFNPEAIGIGIGSGVVIVIMAVVIIILIRKLHSARQRNTARSTTMTDISLPSIGKEVQPEPDDPYDVIDAMKGPDSAVKESPSDDMYERLEQRDVAVPHIYENK